MLTPSLVFASLLVVASEKPDLEIDFEIDAKECAGTFHIKNIGNNPFEFSDKILPWNSRDVSRWVAVKYGTIPNFMLTAATDSWDFFGSKRVVLGPYEKIGGSIALVSLFPELMEPRKSPILIFVRWECNGLMCNHGFVFSGSGVVQPSVKCVQDLTKGRGWDEI